MNSQLTLRILQALAAGAPENSKSADRAFGLAGLVATFGWTTDEWTAIVHADVEMLAERVDGVDVPAIADQRISDVQDCLALFEAKGIEGDAAFEQVNLVWLAGQAPDGAERTELRRSQFEMEPQLSVEERFAALNAS